MAPEWRDLRDLGDLGCLYGGRRSSGPSIPNASLESLQHTSWHGVDTDDMCQSDGKNIVSTEIVQPLKPLKRYLLEYFKRFQATCFKMLQRCG